MTRCSCGTISGATSCPLCGAVLTEVQPTEGLLASAVPSMATGFPSDSRPIEVPAPCPAVGVVTASDRSAGFFPRQHRTGAVDGGIREAPWWVWVLGGALGLGVGISSQVWILAVIGGLAIVVGLMSTNDGDD